MEVVTCVAPVNIALIKYWGKKDEKLITPINDSLSVTLGTGQMCAKTTIARSPNFTRDRMWLNGVEQSLDNSRLQACLQEIQKRSRQQTAAKGDGMDKLDWRIHICSENNFPTAAGLASSAAGYACLVYSLSELYGVSGDVSGVARQGSGSACRSLYGGFVRWHSGTRPDGTDSLATQVCPALHWPQIRIMVLVVNAGRKPTGSTQGMQRSVMTSDLIHHRANHVVPQRMQQIIQAIQERDFATVGRLTMQDSNQLHAICLDTYPPCVYMNDVSHCIAALVHRYNELCGDIKVAYTFDAGPNACLLMKEDVVGEFAAVVSHFFPPAPGNTDFFRGLPIPQGTVPQALKAGVIQQANAIQFVIHTSIGEGPQLLSRSVKDCLVDGDGMPRKLA